MKQVWMISVTHMFVEIYFLTQAALIPVLTREFNLGLLESSLVVTIPGLIQLLMNLLSGFLTERFSTRHLLFASMIAEGVSALMVSQTSEYWILVLGISVMRISSPIYHISGLTRISRLVERRSINRTLGFHSALGSMGAAIGLLSLSFFLSSTGWRWLYIFWAPLVLSWSVILLRNPQLEKEGIESSGNEAAPMEYNSVLSSAFIVLLGVIGLRIMGHAGAQTYMTTYLVEMRKMSDSAASLVLGFGTFVGVVGSLYGGYSGDRIGAKKTLGLAITASIISLMFLGLTNQLYLLGALYVTYAFFSASVWTPINSLVAEITPREKRGFSFSIYFFTEGLVFSMAPAIAAAVIGLTQLWYIFPFSTAFLIASLAILQLLTSTDRQSSETSQVRYHSRKTTRNLLSFSYA